jgi:hypothetical protein
MSKKFIISEQEKDQIKKLYNINENWLDDAIGYLKDVGEDAVEYIKDKLDIDDEEEKETETSIIDKDFSEKEKEEIQSGISDLKSKELNSSPIRKLSPKELYTKLNSKLNNKKLSIAIVANAVKESGLRCDAKGDGGSYAKEHSDKSIGGFCSFGLWQFNICAGLGIDLVDKEGVGALTNCDKQIDFMVKHVKKKSPGNKSIKGYIDWFVDNVERPSDREGAKRKRNQWASANIGSFDLDIDDITV